MNGSGTQLCTFHLGGLLLGIDVLRVQEVIRSQPMTRVPRARPEVRGLINLRGQIVTALDLRRRVGLAPPEHEEEQMNVVVRAGDGAVSLLVDEIGDVLQVHDDDYEKAPETLPARLAELVLGIYKLDGALLLHLDVDGAIEAAPGDAKAAA